MKVQKKKKKIIQDLIILHQKYLVHIQIQEVVLENILKKVVVVIFLIKITKIILNWVMLKEVLKI